jgi:hypothetical protein
VINIENRDQLIGLLSTVSGYANRHPSEAEEIVVLLEAAGVEFPYQGELNPTVTCEEAELYHCVAEEASEMIKEVAKGFRFGFHNPYPDGSGETPHSRLQQEMGDSHAVIARLAAKGFIDMTNVTNAAINKELKLRVNLRHRTDQD